MTYGAGINENLREELRWTSSFERTINSFKWCNSSIEVNNIAIPATNIDVWIEKVRFTEAAQADLVIVDEQVNDQVFELDALPPLYHKFISILDSFPNHPAILFTQTFITANNEFHDIMNKCLGDGEWGGCCGEYYWCKRMWEMQDFTQVPLDHFAIPYISYRDLFWPNYYDNSNVRAYWNGAVRRLYYAMCDNTTYLHTYIPTTYILSSLYISYIQVYLCSYVQSYV